MKKTLAILSIIMVFIVFSVSGLSVFADTYEFDGAKYTYTVKNNEATLTGYSGNGTNIVIPDTVNNGVKVTAIGQSLFETNMKIVTVDVPEGVKIIGTSAFDGCIKLKEITLPKTLQQINYSAFYYCNSLQSVHYTGTESDWKKITIDTNDNGCLVKATKDYNYQRADANTASVFDKSVNVIVVISACFLIVVITVFVITLNKKNKKSDK